MKLSIIMPVYNAEKFLEQMAQCVLNQSMEDFELIMVDDGSTDSSGDICDRISETDERVKVIHQKNQGVGEARNIGLKQATGKYIGFVDADDAIHEQMYEILLYVAEKEDADIVMLNPKVVPENFSVSFTAYDKTKISYQNESKEAVFEMMFSKSMSDTPFQVVWDKIYRADIVQKYSFPACGTEDSVWNCYMYHEAKKIVLLNNEEGIYYWIQRKNSVTHKSTFSLFNLMEMQSYLDMVQFLSKYERECLAFGLEKTYKVFLRNRYNSKGTEYEKKVKAVIKMNRDYRKMFWSCKEISILKKWSYTILYYVPFIYSFMRKAMETYSRFK